MKKRRFTEQQIIGLLKEAEAGIAVKDLCRKHGFSDAAFYRWRSKFGGMQVVPLRCKVSARKGRSWIVSYGVCSTTLFALSAMI